MFVKRDIPFPCKSPGHNSSRLNLEKITASVVSSGRKIAFQERSTCFFLSSWRISRADAGGRGQFHYQRRLLSRIVFLVACIDPHLAAGRYRTRWSERAAVPQDLEDQRTPASWEMIPLCKERMEMTIGSPPAPARHSLGSFLVRDDDDSEGQGNRTTLIKERSRSGYPLTHIILHIQRSHSL